MSNKVSFIYVAQDKYSAIARRVKQITQQTRAQFRGMNEDVKRASDRFKQYNKRIQDIRKSATQVGKTLTTHVSLPLAGIGTAALVQSAKFETLGVAFETLIGDSKKAKETLDGLMEFTATTPFQMDEVANAGKQLLAFGVAPEKITDTLRQLGNIASGLGKPLGEFSLIYGKVLAKGKVQGEEMLQLAEKGISLQTILAKKHGITTAQVADAVSKGQVTFDIFADALSDITSKGGKFFQMTEKQSKTLGGLFSTFKDAGVLAFKELGDILVKDLNLRDLLADVIEKINSLTKTIGTFARNNPKITKMVLIFAGLLMILGPVIALGAQLAAGFGIMAIAAATFGVALAPILLTIGAIAAGIAIAIAVVTTFKEELAATGKFIGEFIANAVDKLSGLKSIGEFFGFGDSDVSVSQKSRTDVNVNLNAPEGAVKSVKSTTTGKVAGLNVGVNMAKAL